MPRHRTILNGLTALALFCALSCGPAWADHAVIIGIGNYNDARVPTLPGIDRDVSSARQLAHVFGFTDAQTTVLGDGEATLAKAQAEIHRALTAFPGERAFIYFSGHGTHVLDDEGQRDGALVMADFKPVGGGHAAGALLGHWIGSELKAARAGNVLLLVDACNSGEITKEFQLLQANYGPAVNKYFATPGFPSGERPLMWKGVDSSAGWIAMSAVQDDQYAPASSVGSPFTNALQIALTSARQAHTSPTPVQLREAVLLELQKLGVPTDLGPKGANPHLWGDPTLLSRALTIEPAPGRVWAKLQKIVAASTPGAVSLHMANPQTHRGQPLQFELDLQRGGYVTILNANEKDESEVLIPNAAVPELHLPAGHYVLPRDIKRSWIAEEPERTVIAVIVTPQKLNLTPPAGGKSLPGQLPADRLLDQLQAAMIGSATDGGTGAPKTRLYHDRTTDEAQPSPMVTRPEAVSIESEIVP